VTIIVFNCEISVNQFFAVTGFFDAQINPPEIGHAKHRGPRETEEWIPKNEENCLDVFTLSISKSKRPQYALKYLCYTLFTVKNNLKHLAKLNNVITSL
jgi:hypothetical protein